MKKLITILLIFSLIFGLVGCSTTENKSYDIVGQTIDGAGRTIDVRTNAKELTCASVYYVAAPFFVALKISDRVLAVNTRNAFLTYAEPVLDSAGTVGRGSVDLEKLASYNPDCLVHRSNDPKTIEAVEKLGIDCICITVESEDDIKNTLSLLGTYFGVDERANEVITFMNEKLEYIDSIVDTIPKDIRKTALLMGGEIGRVAGCDMFQSWMIEKAGGIPVVKDGENHNWINIGVEKVLSLNPDTLFLTSSTKREYEVQDLLCDKAFSEMKAVKENSVFEMPTKLDSWDMPGLNCILGILFMIREMYPEYLSLSDFEDQVDDYYRFIYGKCFDSFLGLDYSKF